MFPAVSWQDVQARWRPLTLPEQEVATVRLLDAAALIHQSAPTAALRLSAGDLSEQAFIAVQVEMVLRVLRNPSGHRTGSISVDDATRSWTVDSSTSTAALYVTEAEVAVLSGVQAGVTEWAGSMPTGA